MISISGLTKKYKHKLVFEDAECTFDKGKICFIMGSNGSGKTTLIKCISGLESYSGSILFDGSVSRNPDKQKIMIIWDDSPFYQNLNGIDNLELFSYGCKSKKEIKEIAGKYLNEETLKSKVKNYSYGQKKKLALALSDVTEPDILIMDEITNGLDRATLKLLSENLKSNKNHRLTILTGHHLEYYSKIIDDLYMIKQNKIVKTYENFLTEKISLEEIYDSEIG